MKNITQIISITVLMFNVLLFSELSKAQEVSESATAEENYSFHAQATIVTQGHYPFTSPYQGKNSFVSVEDAQTSITNTYFGGIKGSWGEFYINPELAAGSGLSKTLGIAGFPNGEIYRVDNAAPKWNIARFYVKKVFGLGGETEKIEDEINQVATSYDVKRFSVVLGKFALNDFFDNNTFSHDPRTQFLNWSLMDYGAWDYAADTRGYSWGVYLEYNQKDWAVRFASVLEPESANEMNYDMNLAKAHGNNLEVEYR
ncbi:MAG TPA: carbohydrate porin, partial [Bdellovibrio sp.]|nr:carbohydrate porin [Bdellovibrio sp.]